TTTSYDPLNRLIQSVDPVGTLSWDYLPHGELSRATDRLNHLTKYDYDLRGWQTDMVEAADDPKVKRTTDLKYDLAGNLLERTSGQPGLAGYALPSTTAYLYDALNRRFARTEAASTDEQRTTGYGYDLAGNLTLLTDPLGRITRSAYDVRDRVVAVY